MCLNKSEKHESGRTCKSSRPFWYALTVTFPMWMPIAYVGRRASASSSRARSARELMPPGYGCGIRRRTAFSRAREPWRRRLIVSIVVLAAAGTTASIDWLALSCTCGSDRLAWNCGVAELSQSIAAAPTRVVKTTLLVLR